MTLVERKGLLAVLIAAADDKHLQFSGDFDDPIELLQTCQKMSLEGIVSKRLNSLPTPLSGSARWKSLPCASATMATAERKLWGPSPRYRLVVVMAWFVFAR